MKTLNLKWVTDQKQLDNMRWLQSIGAAHAPYFINSIWTGRLMQSGYSLDQAKALNAFVASRSELTFALWNPSGVAQGIVLYNKETEEFAHVAGHTPFPNN